MGHPTVPDLRPPARTECADRGSFQKVLTERPTTQKRGTHRYGPFAVKLARSGIRLEVPAGVSLMETLEKAGKSIPTMCRKGICGECSLPVLQRAPLHRDLYLTDQEKAENTTMMCCVSRSPDQEFGVGPLSTTTTIDKDPDTAELARRLWSAC